MVLSASFLVILISNKVCGERKKSVKQNWMEIIYEQLARPQKVNKQNWSPLLSELGLGHVKEEHEVGGFGVQIEPPALFY